MTKCEMLVKIIRLERIKKTAVRENDLKERDNR